MEEGKIKQYKKKRTQLVKLQKGNLYVQGKHKGCFGINVLYFRKTFLRLIYTGITKHAYIRRRTVTEIIMREKYGLLEVQRIVCVT